MRTLPTSQEMYSAIASKDTSYEGVFMVAVRTTGVFCRPGCPARTPRLENVEFFATAAEALEHGYRACLRCRPLEDAGATPGWVSELLARVEADPTLRWRDRDIRAAGVDPARARPVPFCFHGFLPPPETWARVLVWADRERWLAR